MAVSLTQRETLSHDCISGLLSLHSERGRGESGRGGTGQRGGEGREGRRQGKR